MAGRGEHMASERRIAAAERHRQALDLRKAGASYRAIAAKLGYDSPSSVHKAVAAALRRITEEPAAEVRTLELERLDALTIALWPQAAKGHLGAVDRLLRVMERRAKLLGLDAPERVAMSGDFTETVRLIGVDPEDV